MRKLTSVAVAAALLLAICVEASGQTRWPDARERRQRASIRQGIREGDLTRREAVRLGAQQRRIERFERRAGSDGRLTRRERHRLDHMLDRSRRDIYRQRHDGQRRDR